MFDCITPRREGAAFSPRPEGLGLHAAIFMRRLKSIGAFWYDFVIGDDWRVAVVVVAALALTALLVHAAGVNDWWLLPLCVFAALGWSLRRATRP